MKKVLTAIILFTVLLSFCCCNVGNSSSEIVCYVPDGAPALAAANIIADKSVGGVAAETYVTTGENVVAKCASGEADMAVLPTNAAVTVLSKRSEYCLFTVNVLGLLYVVGTRQITDLNDLVGQTVCSIGFANTPEFVFKKILDSSNIQYCAAGDAQAQSKVSLDYYTDGATIIPLVLSGKAQFAVLGEPAVTNLINKAAAQDKTVFRLFDLQYLWKEATDAASDGYPQASLIVKRELLEKDGFAEALMQKLSDNISWLLQNAASLNALMHNAGSSLDVGYTEEIIGRCNLAVVPALSVKNDIENYLRTFEAMQKFLPLDDSLFYDFGS